MDIKRTIQTYSEDSLGPETWLRRYIRYYGYPLNLEDVPKERKVFRVFFVAHRVALNFFQVS